MQLLPFEPTFPLQSLNGWPTLAGLLFVSASMSLLYSGTTALLFEATRHLKTTPAPVAFIARNSLIIFLVHMPVYYVLTPILVGMDDELLGEGRNPAARLPARPRPVSEGIVAVVRPGSLRGPVFEWIDMRVRIGKHAGVAMAQQGDCAMKPRVDVIVPCYNYGDVLEACVRSILTQQEVDVRVMIMDDASSDTTQEVGSRLTAADPRVKYASHTVNRGHIAYLQRSAGDADRRFRAAAVGRRHADTRRAATRDARDDRAPGSRHGLRSEIPFRQSPPADAAPSTTVCTHGIIQ